MTFTRVEMDYDGSILTLEHDVNQPMLVFHGPGGLETAIRFDGVMIRRNKIHFYVEPRSGLSKRKTGSIEATERIVSFITEAQDESELEYWVEERRPQ